MQKTPTHPSPDPLLKRRTRRPPNLHLPIKQRRADQPFGDLCAVRLGERRGKSAREGPEDIGGRVAAGGAEGAGEVEVVEGESLEPRSIR